MREDILNRVKKKSPDFVWDSLNEDYSTKAIIKIRSGYNLKQDDVDAITDIIGLTVLKDIRIENIISSLKKDLNLDDKIAKEIALIILTEIFYPIKDYFPSIEDEILKLGGEIPKEAPKKTSGQMLKRDEEMEKMKEKEEEEERQRMADTIIEKSINDLIKEFPAVGEQQIGVQKAIEVESMPVPMKPLVKYWLQDYLEKMGNYEHSNLERVQYVYHDKNTREMNEEERRQLGLVLKSFDEEIVLPYSIKMRKIDFSRIGE